jgi:galactokinase
MGRILQCRENHYFSIMIDGLRNQFEQLYGSTALLAAAPGRVNLIGEHTDYNEGFVLPGAVDKRIYVAIAKNQQGMIRMQANQFQEKFSFSPAEIRPVSGWATYLLGMIYHLQQLHGPLGGLDILVHGDVPLGAGMSSSAALCSAFGFGLNALFSLGMTRMELALMGQKTEHAFAGVQCGIMDQFASLHGRAGHVMKLDCRSLDFEYIPFNYPEVRIVLVNTMVRHALGDTKYNERRKECEEGVALLKKHVPDIHSLRDVTDDMLKGYQKQIPELVYRRCAFVVQENERLLAGCRHLVQGDLRSFGQLMYQAHEGLSKEYEVSCAESDFLVQQAKTSAGVLGSRQMGGGFGGCTINLIQSEAVDNFTRRIRLSYAKQFGKVPDVYITQIEDGAKIIP